MNPVTLQPWIEMIGGTVGVLAVILGGSKALAEWRSSIDLRKAQLAQNKREFRHKQAIFARDFLKEIFSDPKARDALKMLDWLETDYTDSDGNTFRIVRDRLQHALRTTNLTFKKDEAFVRFRFEALYDYLEQLENLIGLEIINFEDVETAFRFYMLRALRKDIQHFEFLDAYDYPRAKKFLLRFQRSGEVDNCCGKDITPEPRL